MKDFIREDILFYSKSLVKEMLQEKVDTNVICIDNINISNDNAINLMIEDVVKNPFFAYELEKDIKFFESYQLEEVSKTSPIKEIQNEVKRLESSIDKATSVNDSGMYQSIYDDLGSLLDKANKLESSNDKTTLVDKINNMRTIIDNNILAATDGSETPADSIGTGLWEWGKSLVTSSLFTSKLSTGLILAGTVIGLYYLYKKFWDKDCSSLQGPAKAECELKLMNASIEKLKNDRAKCNEAENPTKCKQEFASLLEKWDTKKKELLSN